MKTITEHKAEATLNKAISYFLDGKMVVLTRKGFIELMHNKRCFVKTVQTPSEAFNRAKYNRMDGKLQEAYEKRCNSTKEEYRLYISDKSSYVITKAEYDYFNTLNEQPKTTEEINKENFKSIIGKKYRHCHRFKEIVEVIDARDIHTHVMGKTKTFCVELDNETYMPIESFFDEYIQIA